MNRLKKDLNYLVNIFVIYGGKDIMENKELTEELVKELGLDKVKVITSDVLI